MEDGISEEDTRLVYAADPMALEKYHFQGEEINYDIIGYLPAHMLCLKRNPPLQLKRFFSTQNTRVFGLSCIYEDNDSDDPLHIAAEYCESVELLQVLLQIDVTITKKKTTQHGETSLGSFVRESIFLLK